MKLNYKEDMRIDESALDIEWLEQPSLAMKYGRYWAECKEKVALADEQVKIIRSELIQLANTNPDKYLGKGNKPTSVTLEAFFRTHEKHTSAKEEWLKAVKELDFAEIAKNEISFTRKSALENMVKLFVGGYNAGPSAPRDIIRERRNRDASRGESNKRVRLNRN